MPPERRDLTTEPLYIIAYVGFARPPWWEGLGRAALALLAGEARRFVATVRGDVRLLRIAWCAVRVLLS